MSRYIISFSNWYLSWKCVCSWFINTLQNFLRGYYYLKVEMCRDKLILELCLIQYSIKQNHLIFKLKLWRKDNYLPISSNFRSSWHVVFCSILLILLDNPILPESDSQIYVCVNFIFFFWKLAYLIPYALAIRILVLKQ